MTTEQAPSELTDAQIQEIAHKDEFWFTHLPNAFCYTPFARAVIAADRALVAEQVPHPCEEAARSDLLDELEDCRLENVDNTAGSMLGKAIAWINGERDDRALVASQAQPAAEPGSARARFDWLMAELEKRFPDPTPFSSTTPPECKYIAAIDAATHQQPAKRAS